MTFSSPSGRSSATASPISPRLSRTSVFLPAFLILLGAFFRIGGLARNSHFHADEALFASHARQIVLQGDWNLNEVATDKPPTTFFLVGISLSIWGENEFAARIPNTFFSLIELAVFYALARHITGDPHVANMALLLLALSPLDIGYGPTVFQDTPMLAWILLAAWFAARRRWGLAGFGLGLAVIMKPTGLWLGPLVVGIGLISGIVNIAQPLQPFAVLRRGAAFLLGIAVPVILIVLWDQSRLAQSFIELGSHNNNPGRFIRSDEVWPRAEAWLELVSQGIGNGWLAIGLGVMGVTWLVANGTRTWLVGEDLRPSAAPVPQADLTRWLIAGFVVWYMGIYWLVAFSTWDRYILPIMPFLILVAAQSLVWLAGYWRGSLIIIGLLVISLSWTTAIDAVERTDPDNLQDIDRLARTLNQDYAGQIVYDNWLGWHLQWYLGAEPQVWVVYFPTPEDLAHNLRDLEGVRYLVVPSTDTARPWLHILALKGIESKPVYQTQTGLFILYRLTRQNDPTHHNALPKITPIQ